MQKEFFFVLYFTIFSSLKVCNKSTGRRICILRSVGIQDEFFLKKMGQPRPLFIVYFQSFQTNIIIIFTTNICEKSPSSIGLGFEPTTLEHESPPITTRPGLPPLQDEFRYPDECTEMSIQVIIRCQVNFRSLSMRPFFGHSLTWLRISWQRTFTVRGRITVRLVSSFTRLDLIK